MRLFGLLLLLLVVEECLAFGGKNIVSWNSMWQSAGVVVLLLLCASVWFLKLLLVVEECLAFGVRMLSGGILRGSQ